MLKAGITKIFANEIDLTLARGLVNDGNEFDPTQPVAPGGDEEPPVEEAPPEEEAESPLDLQFSMLGIDIILGMLKAETRENPFLQLAREVMESAEELKRQVAVDALLPVLGALLEIYNTESRVDSQKEFIRYSLEQITSGSMTAYLLDKIEERAVENEVVLDGLCAAIGKSFAYPLIQRLCVVELLHARKAIALALTRSGEVALPALASMLKDERWYVVRNMVTILVGIASPDSLKALQQAATHPETKVRKEVAKSLVKLPSRDGENVLVYLLADIDKEVVRQVIFSLGVLRSRVAVRPLLDILMASDAFLKELEIKKLTVAALGRIGDKQATEPLLNILDTIGWLAPLRWMELKTAVAVALGQLGDESALPHLKKLAKRDSTLGEACSDAADNLEQVIKWPIIIKR
ncbi:MAG: HEAT repeat domain-containing protein [Methanothrix sp.]|nr:MAG: HEAT repeat domain-containing protein [Methanothrix sp.]